MSQKGREPCWGARHAGALGACHSGLLLRALGPGLSQTKQKAGSWPQRRVCIAQPCHLVWFPK